MFLTKSNKKNTFIITFIFSTIFISVMAVGCNDNKKDSKTTSDTLPVLSVHNESDNNNTISEYINFVSADNNKMKLDHAYTSEALLKLTDATKAVADKAHYTINEDLNKIKDYAKQVTEDKLATTHANDIKKAADVITKVLGSIQEMKYPALSNEAGQLKEASSAINPDVLTLQQKNEIKKYFEKAADLLAKMK